MKTVAICVAVAILSYLLGSLNFGIVFSKIFKHKDVRESGSGNAGATNMMRSYGKIWGVITILCDMAKVAVAIVIAFAILRHFDLFNDIEAKYGANANVLIKTYSGFFCVLGHIFPCFFDFKGGKGVATSGGMVFVIDWRIALILLVIFFIVLLLTKYVSLGSLTMAFLFPVMMLVFYKSVTLTLIASAFAIIVFVAHRGNIKKLINHTENKISFSKHKVDD